MCLRNDEREKTHAHEQTEHNKARHAVAFVAFAAHVDVFVVAAVLWLCCAHRHINLTCDLGCCHGVLVLC